MATSACVLAVSGTTLAANEARRPGGERATQVYVCPVGDVARSDLRDAAKALANAFGTRSDVTDGIEMPPSAYRPARRQYDASVVLSALRKEVRRRRLRGRLLGVTSRDLYSDGLNFVFGQAEINGIVAVISTARLDPAFWRDEPDEKLKRRRIAKEAVHELGHVYGLRHCPNPSCVMFFSNSLADTDRKRAEFCSKCRARLK
ncbi:MAG: archaemetzincin family Zn-dependent metalloprotease [Armatimonadota bacterium]